MSTIFFHLSINLHIKTRKVLIAMSNNKEIQSLLFSLMFELKSEFTKAMKGNRFELAPMHQKVLTYFCCFPGATQQELVEQSGRDKAQITRLLKELEVKGFISRQKDESDKRSYKVRATEKGNAAFMELKKHEDTITMKLLAGFTKNELNQLEVSLKKMRKNLL